MVVHADDGMDEISIGAATRIAELRNGAVSTYEVTPEQFGLERGDIQSLTVADAAQSLQVIKGVLDGGGGPAADIVALNAGAAIYVAGLEDNLADGVAKAQNVLQSGAARRKLDQLVHFTGSV
jgi:anthranilate phosphoribosyltransferase